MVKELIELDDLFRKCPYAYFGTSNGGYNCLHPDCESHDDDTDEGQCFHINCPIGYIPTYNEAAKYDKSLADELKEDLEHDSNYVDVTWLVVNTEEYDDTKVNANFEKLIKTVYLPDSGINRVRKDAIDYLRKQYYFEYYLGKFIHYIIKIAIAHALIQKRKTLLINDFETAISMSMSKNRVWVNKFDVNSATNFMKMVLTMDNNSYKDKMEVVGCD